jgi:hypothetical protein
MKKNLIGLESSSIMPLVTVTPLTQECYEALWDNYIHHTLIAHEDSLTELKNIFKFKADTFYSNPITRLEKVKDFSPVQRESLKGMALKLLLDGQMGGWVGNKNSRVQTFFFSDVIDEIDSNIKDPEKFSVKLIESMKRKIETYNRMLTPDNGILTIDISLILPYWGLHNITSSVFSEKRKVSIKILPNCETLNKFQSLPSATRRDAYHYHMLKKENVQLILVGDANYKKNICACADCSSYNCEVKILTDRERKKILKLI